MNATRTRTARPITPRQVEFLQSLRGEFLDLMIELSPEDGEEIEAGRAQYLDNVRRLSTAEASRQIDATKASIAKMRQQVRNAKVAQRATEPAAAPAEIEAGMYILDGEIYKVQVAVHGSGRPYAKRLVPGEFGQASFEYARGIVRRLRPEHRMTLDQAREYGALYGVCVRCGATLTREESIERAMGPVCAGKI
jgi:hypothetical protein